MLALRELVEDLNHEVALYKVFKSVPAQDQTNVRNDMYVASEAIRLMQKSGKPAFTAAENAALANYKSKVERPPGSSPTGSRSPWPWRSDSEPWSAGSASWSPWVRKSASSI